MRRQAILFTSVLLGIVFKSQLSAANPPAKLVDLSCWKLTLPVSKDPDGNADEIRWPRLKSFHHPMYFFVDDATKGVVFRAHSGGSTTKGSKYPRCELREMTADGKSKAAWGTDDGRTHTMTMEVAIRKTPPVKRHVVCAQIHNASDDVMMVRLEGTKLFIERKPFDDVSLDRNYKLGSRFGLKIQSHDGHIKVWYDGVLKLDWQVSQKECYFKVGCYTQSNPKKRDAPASYGEVVIFQLQVEHREEREHRNRAMNGSCRALSD